MKHFIIQTFVVFVVLVILILTYHLIIVPYISLLGGFITTIAVLSLGLFGGILAEQCVRHLTKEKS